MAITSVDNAQSSTVGLIQPSFASTGESTGASQSAATSSPAGPAQASQQSAPQVQASQADVQSAAKKVEDFVQSAASAVSFSVDQSTGTTVVKVIDTANNSVIRQIPSQEVLAIAQALDKLQGLLVKDKA